MVIQKLKDLLGANIVQEVKNKLGVDRTAALKDMIVAAEGLVLGEYKSPAKQVTNLEKRLSSRSSDFKKLQKKLWQNQKALAEVEGRLEGLMKDLVEVEVEKEECEVEVGDFVFEEFKKGEW